jgi:hypothetical protein
MDFRHRTSSVASFASLPGESAVGTHYVVPCFSHSRHAQSQPSILSSGRTPW